MICVYFLVDKKFKIERIIDLWLKVFLFIAPITLILYFLNRATLFDVINSLFPLLRRSIWYVSAYIAMLALSPMLNRILKWEKEALEYIIILGIILICVICSVSGLMDTYIDSYIWFIYVYILMGYLKTYRGSLFGYGNNSKTIRNITLLMSVLLYSVLVIIQLVSKGNSNKILQAAGKAAGLYLSDYKSLINFVISLCFFVCISNIKPFRAKQLNQIASHTLMVYIFHQTPALITILWFDIFRAEVWRTSVYSPLIVILCTIIIFIMAIVIDVLMNYIIRKVKKSRKYNYLTSMINKRMENIA